MNTMLATMKTFPLTSFRFILILYLFLYSICIDITYFSYIIPVLLSFMIDLTIINWMASTSLIILYLMIKLWYDFIMSLL